MSVAPTPEEFNFPLPDKEAVDAEILRLAKERAPLLEQAAVYSLMMSRLKRLRYLLFGQRWEKPEGFPEVKMPRRNRRGKIVI